MNPSSGTTHNRRHFIRFLAAFLMLAGTTGFQPAMALADAKTDALAKWNSLSPETKLLYRKRWEEFMALPPEARASMKASLSLFKSLTDDQKQQVRKNYEEWKALSPDQKAALKGRFAEWKTYSEEKKNSLRERAKELGPATGETAK